MYCTNVFEKPQIVATCGHYNQIYADKIFVIQEMFRHLYVVIVIPKAGNNNRMRQANPCNIPALNTGNSCP